MKVTTVSASVRFSKALGDGQHKTVEVGAEASLDSEVGAEASLDSQESWEAALAQLYADLGRELKSLWGNGNHKAENGAVAVAEAPVVPEPMQKSTRPAALLPGAPGRVQAVREGCPDLVQPPKQRRDMVQAEPPLTLVRGWLTRIARAV